MAARMCWLLATPLDRFRSMPLSRDVSPPRDRLARAGLAIPPQQVVNRIHPGRLVFRQSRKWLIFLRPHRHSARSLVVIVSFLRMGVMERNRTRPAGGIGRLQHRATEQQERSGASLETARIERNGERFVGATWTVTCQPLLIASANPQQRSLPK
jgi:hypothetical protein